MNVETGACFCGAIGAEMRGEPFWVCFDHDDDCRRATGGPLAVWVGYRPHQVTWRGTVATFSRTPGVTRGFCARCGTPILYEDAGLPDELYLTIGFLDHPERVRPQAHAYWHLKLPWIAIDDDLPRIDRYSRARASGFGDPSQRKT